MKVDIVFYVPIHQPWYPKKKESIDQPSKVQNPSISVCPVMVMVGHLRAMSHILASCDLSLCDAHDISMLMGMPNVVGPRKKKNCHNLWCLLALYAMCMAPRSCNFISLHWSHVTIIAAKCHAKPYHNTCGLNVVCCTIDAISRMMHKIWYKSNGTTQGLHTMVSYIVCVSWLYELSALMPRCVGTNTGVQQQNDVT